MQKQQLWRKLKPVALYLLLVCGNSSHITAEVLRGGGTIESITAEFGKAVLAILVFPLAINALLTLNQSEKELRNETMWRTTIFVSCLYHIVAVLLACLNHADVATTTFIAFGGLALNILVAQQVWRYPPRLF